MRRQRGGACANDREHRADVGCGTTFDQPFGAQRCSAVHGDGRDGGSRTHGGSGRARDSYGGRPAGGGGPGKRDRRRAHSARVGAAALYRNARHCDAARPHRAALWGKLRRGNRPGTRRRHHRIIGWICSGLPCAVRIGRSRRRRAAGLSTLSAYPQRARLRGGGDRDDASHALGNHARNADGGASQGAAQGRARRQPCQSDRHHDASGGVTRSDLRR